MIPQKRYLSMNIWPSQISSHQIVEIYGKQIRLSTCHSSPGDKQTLKQGTTELLMSKCPVFLHDVFRAMCFRQIRESCKCQTESPARKCQRDSHGQRCPCSATMCEKQPLQPKWADHRLQLASISRLTRPALPLQHHHVWKTAINSWLK